MSDFHDLIEREIPRLRRYARALTRSVDRADDLAGNPSARSCESAFVAGGYRPPGMAFHHYAQSVRQHGPARDARAGDRRT